ncbi:conserved protein of unknown function [Tenacibaculum sp. 190130A14a]|uniref:Uncharacterized protein n=1 Tax=Tenacibaculum polynesiense TaxID=3137857 RepID=A0ABM9P9V2_9FLAO
MKTHHSFFIALLLPIYMVFGQPNLASKQLVDSVVVYQDFYKKGVFYYAPYGLELIKSEEGKPSFKFLQIRYTGTRATADQGTKRFRSLIHFKVVQHIPTKERLARVREFLKNSNKNIKELQPIAVSNLKAYLTHGASDYNDTITNKVSGGFFENSQDESSATNWKERDFTIRLSEHDSQIFWSTLQGEQPTLSVNYTFSAKFLNADATELKLTGNGDLRKTLEESLSSIDSTKTNNLSEQIFKSEALNIQIDTQKWPDLLKRVDINQRTIPPDYAALDIYCFDFNNDIAEGVYAKRIEIKAKGVSGSDIVLKKMFKANEPEVYAQTIRFTHAVKLSEPYEYRITTIFTDGTYERSKWKENESWHERLDITQKPNNQ